MAHGLEQQGDPILLAKPDDCPDESVEGPADHTGLVANAQGIVKTDHILIIAERDHPFDQPIWQGRGMAAPADEMQHTKGAIDRTPAADGVIDFHEHIAGEQGHALQRGAPGVTCDPLHAGAVGSKGLAPEIGKREVLLARLRAHSIPPHPLTVRHPLASLQSVPIRTLFGEAER